MPIFAKRCTFGRFGIVKKVSVTEANFPYHIPAFLNKSVDQLIVQPSGVYVDATFGGGGHSREILSRLTPFCGKKMLYSFDKDSDVLPNLIADDRWEFVYGDFTYIVPFLDYYGVQQVDGIIADIGVSFHHFDTESRGFSFRFNGPLDMRMNQRGGRTVADIVNTYSKEDLVRIFVDYGDIKNASYYASLILQSRQIKPIATTFQLVSVLSNNRYREMDIGIKKDTFSPSFKHDITCIFQALRIEANGELTALQTLLLSSLKLLKKGGRIVLIAYHSIEDRLIKNFFRSGCLDGRIQKDFYGNVICPFRVIKTPLMPDNVEVERNPRSRSAKMRIAERI